ncbi:MAG: TetR/AcrR family transcriptional regulator [Betaproteobacteria bacterium]|nr:TetR/AcrR family transcriptional regulator [Betaproteobacteria bacterium]NCZ28619.1 TetR/AcrR family transcriptional regulator [Betaproteobacteria bacterium]
MLSGRFACQSSKLLYPQFIVQILPSKVNSDNINEPATSVRRFCNVDAGISASRSFHHGSLRRSLIEAALSEPDIEGLSLRQLAAGLGVTAAAAYRHFGSREELLFEVARCGFDRLRHRFASAFNMRVTPADASEARLRLIHLARAYLEFADDEPALWRLIFGAQAQVYRQTIDVQGDPKSYEYLPAALSGLYLKGVITVAPSERDALFAWSAVHGAATLRSGRVPAAMIPIPDLANEVAVRVIRALK